MAALPLLRVSIVRFKVRVNNKSHIVIIPYGVCRVSKEKYATLLTGFHPIFIFHLQNRLRASLRAHACSYLMNLLPAQTLTSVTNMLSVVPQIMSTTVISTGQLAKVAWLVRS